MMEYGYDIFTNEVYFIVKLPDTTKVSSLELIKTIQEGMSNGKSFQEAISSFRQDIPWVISTIILRPYYDTLFRISRNKYCGQGQFLKNRLNICLNIGEEKDKRPILRKFWLRNPEEFLRAVLKKRIGESISVFEYYAINEFLRKDT